MATQAMKVYTRRQRKDVNHTYWNRMCQTRAAVGQFPSWKQADWWKQQKPKCAYIQSHNHCGKSCGDGARGGVPNPERSWESHLAWASVQFSSVAQSCLTLQPHEPQHARPPCPSPTPRVHPNPCPLSRWCHPTISSSVIPFSNRRGYFSKVTIFSNISSYTDPG